MKKRVQRNVGILIWVWLAVAVFLPTVARAQSDTAALGPPPIAAPLVREGDLAVRLASGLGLVPVVDEVEAENRLADGGISPRNGWIADYPVTPDIIGELQEAIGSAADAGTVSIGRDEALLKFNEALTASGLSITPYSPTGGGEPAPADSGNYPNPSVVNNYYYSEGPPVVTCYAPPPDFYYLYAWVPFPFWWSGFWFPGFFVLHDFHRTIIVNRRPVYVSNHFRDIRDHRVLRIDPTARFQGRTFGGIGAARSKGFLPTGVPRSEQRIFNNPPPRNSPRTPVSPSRPSPDRMGNPSLRGSSPVGRSSPVVQNAPRTPSGGASIGTPTVRSGGEGPSPQRIAPAAPPSPGATAPAALHGSESGQSQPHGGEAFHPSAAPRGGGSPGRGRER